MASSFRCRVRPEGLLRQFRAREPVLRPCGQDAARGFRGSEGEAARLACRPAPSAAGELLHPVGAARSRSGPRPPQALERSLQGRGGRGADARARPGRTAGDAPPGRSLAARRHRDAGRDRPRRRRREGQPQGGLHRAPLRRLRRLCPRAGRHQPPHSRRIRGLQRPAARLGDGGGEGAFDRPRDLRGRRARAENGQRLREGDGRARRHVHRARRGHGGGAPPRRLYEDRGGGLEPRAGDGR